MTLKEKFDKVELNLSECPYNFIGIEASNKCEKIADEFAVGFADWFTNEQSPYSITYGNQEVRFSDFRKDYTIKELLEIYKKQKGL